MGRPDFVTPGGVNLSNWDKIEPMIPERRPGNKPTFVHWFKEKEPEQWNKLLRFTTSLLRKDFDFLLEWRLEISEIRQHAETLLQGGVLAHLNLDFRIAGLLAVNAFDEVLNA